MNRIFIIFIQFLFHFCNSKETWPSSCPEVAKINCKSSKYYSNDGSCNNLKVVWWGKSGTPLARYQPSQYGNNVGSPRSKSSKGGKLPNSRSVSLAVDYPRWTIYDLLNQLSHYLTIYAQFTSFDMSKITSGDAKCTCDSTNPECFNIETPPNDKIDSNQKCMVFVRSQSSFPNFNCKSSNREQLNSATHWLDLSQIYGNTNDDSKNLRNKDGTLKTTSIPGFHNTFLPFADVGSCRNDSPERRCFHSGDSRVNENMILACIFTLWVREHNRLVSEMKKLNPQWSGDTLYEEARRLLIAIYQKITYEDYLVIILGKNQIKKHKLQSSKGHYTKYDSKINPQLRNEISTSAGRFGHTLVNAWSLKSDPSLHITGNVTFGSLMIQPGQAYTGGGIDSLCRGACMDTSRGFDASLTDPIQNHLFENPSPKAQTHQNSLSAFNINRGRDHGTPPYNVYRKFCKLHVFKSFNDITSKDMLPETIRDLKKIYKSVDDIDLFVGIISERPLKDGVVGATAACEF